MDWVTENLGNIVVVAVVAAVVIKIVYKSLKDKRSGKSHCGSGCSGCALKDKCH